MENNLRYLSIQWPLHPVHEERRVDTSPNPCMIWSHKLCLHESSNPGSTHFQSRTKFQSTNGCGLSQSGLQSGLGVFTLEVNPG